MKKTIKLLSALSLASMLAFGATACGDQATTEENVAPIQFKYTLETNENDQTDKYYVLSGVTISEKAKSLVNKNDYEGLATLFNTAVPDADYEKPATDYTAESVRKLVIPQTYDGKPVKEIGEEAIVDQSFINEIEVPDSIVEIGEGAFSGLTQLKKITLPFVGGKVNAVNGEKSFGYIFGTTQSDGLTSCAQNYNEGTSSTATYYVPSTLKTVVVTGGNEIKSVDKNFVVSTDDEGNTVYTPTEETTGENVVTITVDDSVYSVAPYAFYNISTVETVEIQGEMEVIGEYTFFGCTGLKEYAFADETVEVKAYAFSGCTALKAVDFNKVTTIGESAFSGCTALGANFETKANPVELKAVTKVGKNAFSGCTALNEVKFMAATTEIGDTAFSGCIAINSLVFNGDVTIGKYAFNGCNERLKEVNLVNVSVVGEGAFYGCEKLETVVLKTGVTPGAYAFGETKYEENKVNP